MLPIFTPDRCWPLPRSWRSKVWLRSGKIKTRGLWFWRSAGDFAWDAILNGSLDGETQDAWSLLFDRETFLDHRQFSSIHKVVLGLSPIDLEAQLKLSTSDINHQDSGGRTPLSWAASKGDSYGVRKLLDYGADIGIVDKNKASPLHYAARAEDPICLKTLLEYGANVNAKNYRGRSPLHFAAAYRNGVRYLEPLINAGADVNVEESSYNETPIIWACEKDNAQNIAYLIQCGATLEIERSRNTPLRAAIVANAYRSLPILLRQGPNYLRKYASGETILHIAASKADQRILEILANGAPLSGLNTEAKNHNGESALDVFNKRFDITPGLIKSFQCLLQKV